MPGESADSRGGIVVTGRGGPVPLSALESTLRIWLQEELPLPDDVGDVSFESPEGTWGTSITRPTVNLFLFDIARAARQATVTASYRGPDGVLVRDQPAPAMTFSYLLSAWGGGTREEHRLLGDAVKAVLRTGVVGDEAHDGEGEFVGPVHLSLSDPEQVRARDLWGGLGGRLRASVVVEATTAVTLERPRRIAPPVRQVHTTLRPPAAVEQDVEGRRSAWFGSFRTRERGRG
jgi:hypothetical protein